MAGGYYGSGSTGGGGGGVRGTTKAKSRRTLHEKKLDALDNIMEKYRTGRISKEVYSKRMRMVFATMDPDEPPF